MLVSRLRRPLLKLLWTTATDEQRGTDVHPQVMFSPELRFDKRGLPGTSKDRLLIHEVLGRSQGWGVRPSLHPEIRRKNFHTKSNILLEKK